MAFSGVCETRPFMLSGFKVKRRQLCRRFTAEQ